MSDAIKKLGFIGLGSMGADIARLLARLPARLTVFDVTPAALAAFEGKAVLAQNVAAVGADADVVGICVRDDAQVDECVDELLPALKPGAILLIHSTVRARTVLAIARRADTRGIDVVDAPVTRTERVATGPFVFCMMGGDEAITTRVKGIVDVFSTNTMHVGALGSAMALKICNNLVSWCNIMVGIEAANVAEAAGVPMDKLMTVMNRNGNLSPPTQGFLEFRGNPGDDAKRAFFASQAGIGEKDLQLAEALASGADAGAPITSTVRALLREGIMTICNRQPDRDR